MQSNSVYGAFKGGSPEVAAQACLRFAGITSFPVDPIKLARALGVSVYGRGGSGDEYYPYSGYFKAGDPLIIEFNETEAIVRQRFTVAHELGHCMLGHENSPRDVGPFYSNGDPRETHANRFAAELLMPADEVRRLFYNGSSLNAMSAHFGVSSDAIGYRLRNLRLV